MRIWICAAALALAACSGGETAANNQAGAAPSTNNQAGAAPSTNQASPAYSPADLADARDLIDRIYAAYAHGDRHDTATLFTPELRGALARMGDTDGGGLSYDPFCQCQDYEDLSHRIISLDPAPGGAVARVEVTNMGEKLTLTLRFARRGEIWQVSDIDNGERGLLGGA
jgi:hypothetical protein